MKHGKKIVLLCFSIGLAVGTILCNFCFSDYCSQSGIVSDYFLSMVSDNPADGTDLFFCIMGTRYKEVLLVGLLAVTIFGGPAVCVVTVKWGMNLSFILSAAVMRFGMKGLLLAVAFLLPHYILYVPAYIRMYLETVNCSSALFYHKEAGRTKEVCLRYYMNFLLCAVLIFCGIWLETYVNPVFLRKMLVWF